MSNLRLCLMAVGASVAFGCAGVAPVAGQSKPPTKTDDEYEGWLFKSLANRGTTAQSAVPNASPAGATSPAAIGPLVPGPATPNASKVATSPTGPELPSDAGPPPSIPPELPPPPAGATSLTDATQKSEKKGFELSDLAPENVYKNLKNAAGYGPDEKIARATLKEAEGLFDEAKTLLRAGKAGEAAAQFKVAAPKFATAADRWPDSALEERALYLQAECEFFSDQYPKAHDTIGGLLKKYTNTRYLDTVVKREFIMGQYWEQLQNAKPLWLIAPNLTDKGRPTFDTLGYAVQAYERVRLNDPIGPLADDAVYATGNLYFREGRFEDAANQYDILIKQYPNSEHQAKAHILCLQAKMRIYQGTMYIGAPLDDAKKIADQTLNQYGDRLGDERQRVAQARAQIIEEKANRDYSLGQYYENHSEYGAARMYYKSVIDQYPTTDKAKEARERMETIRDKPDKPPSRFAWLTGMFGTKKQ